MDTDVSERNAGNSTPDDPIRDQPEGGAERMAKYKQELSEKVAVAAEEIERLRMRQCDLEKEKTDLEELKRKQENYEYGKKEMIEKLARSLVLLEKEEEQTVHMRELLSETRGRFQDMLGDLRCIDESSWADGDFRGEVTKAAALVDSAKSEYRRSIARIDAVGLQMDSLGRKRSESEGVTLAGGMVEDKGLAFWVKVGLGISLPVIVFLSLLFILWLHIRSALIW